MHERTTNDQIATCSRPLLRASAFTFVEASEAAATKFVTFDSAIRMPAVSVAPEERSLISRGSNEYFVIVGSRRQLATRSFCFDFLAELGRQLDCPRSLSVQASFLEVLFASYFGRNSNQIGWISYLGLRRPQNQRSSEDSAVQIVGEAMREPGHSESLTFDRTLYLNDVPITASNACFAISPSRTGHRLRYAAFQNRVLSEYFAKSPSVKEWWYAPVARRGDEELILRRRIPALQDAGYYSNAEHAYFATTALVSLVKVTADLRAMNCTLELLPSTGEIVSLRGYQTDLPTLLLLASRVEETAVHAAISRMLGRTESDENGNETPQRSRRR